jgi:hypothetical protein
MHIKPPILCISFMFFILIELNFISVSCKICKQQCEGKVYPRTDHEGPEGEYMYSSTRSLTLTPEGGGWLTPLSRRFTPRKDPGPFV